MQHDEKLHIPIEARSAGVAIIDSEDRILLVKEKIGSKADLWHIPAGGVKANESLESAALREAQEEIGLYVNLKEYLNTYVGRFEDGDYVARHVWLATINPGEIPKPASTEEIAECRYFNKSKFEELYSTGEIRMYHTKLIFEEALSLKGK